jgi:hypothetical protein
MPERRVGHGGCDVQLTARMTTALFVGIPGFVAFVAFVACSSETLMVEGRGGAAGGTVSPPKNGLGPMPPPCPTTMPQVNDFCVDPGMVCEYGISPRAECNQILRCNSNQAWVADRRAACAENCPSARADISVGRECGDTTAICSYVEATCGCVEKQSDAGAGTDSEVDAGVTASKGTWVCVTPPAGCPSMRPTLGTQCVKPMTCDYGTCELHVSLNVACKDNAWVLASRPSCDP